MSYDFFVWSGPAVRDPDEVQGLIEAVCEGNLDVLDQCPRVGEFLSNLFDEYPPLGSSNPPGDTQWSFTDDTSDRHALLSVQDSSQSVCKRIVSLSRRHRLLCFDLQTQNVF
jgi:hypothetical protein